MIRKTGIDILVVEDSPTQARFLEQLLQEAGYQVTVVRNGREGMDAARVNLPDLILSDIAMPEMDGFSMCQQIKRDPVLRHIPIILLTALSSLYDVINALGCGADNFIRKPFNNAYLLERVRIVLANHTMVTDEAGLGSIQISLGGQSHLITAERQQIFDLLISTYEEAIQLTEQLTTQQLRLERSNQSTAELYKVAEALNTALSEQAVCDLAIERLLDFPGVLDVRITLFDRDGRQSTLASRDLADDAGTSMFCQCEQQQPLRDYRRLPQVASCCEGLTRPHACFPLTMANGMGGIVCLLTANAEVDDQDRHMLAAVAHQISVALERARLYTDMEAKVEERTTAWRSERDLLSAVVKTSGALVCMVDAAGIIRLFNPACEQIMGWAATEAIGRPCWEVFGNSTLGEGLQQFFGGSQENHPPSHLRGEWTSRDGSIHSIIWSSASLRRSDGSIEYFVSTGVDVTKLRRAEEKVRYLSNFDTLTGLPNQILMRDRVRQLQEKVLADDQVLGFLVLKPARLGRVRASLGIETERSMLTQIAERLNKWQRNDASVARVGECTFAVVTVKNSATELAMVARQLIAVMEEPFMHGQQELHLDPCIGIALFPNDGDDYDGIFQGAEAAMRRAISSKAERYEFFRPELNEGANERFELESALRRALERNEFLLHYQPQVSLISGAIVGVESLLRWQHPKLGLIGPGRFISLAEETGLILAIGEWVLREACEQRCAWQREGLPMVPVSVNLSARQFSTNISATVARILTETGLEPRMLELELTESASMEDPEKTFQILRQLKDMGVQIAIDDFGTGYSNLNYLKRFPVDKLKLDQSFVKDITADPDDLSIARAVIAMAHGLRLTVIAEGVETPGQLALLAENGCDEIQGYFFSRPVDAAACGRLLREKKSLALDSLLREPYERTLLCVDDELNLLSAIQREMRYKGYRVLIASDAAAAFEILATVEVGVILCDQRMHGMSGTEFLSRIKYLYPDVTRMVLSGYTDLQSVTDAVNHGAIFKFLTKPWNEDELAEAVREGFSAFELKRHVRGIANQRRGLRAC